MPCDSMCFYHYLLYFWLHAIVQHYESDCDAFIVLCVLMHVGDHHFDWFACAVSDNLS